MAAPTPVPVESAGILSNSTGTQNILRTVSAGVVIGNGTLNGNSGSTPSE